MHLKNIKGNGVQVQCCRILTETNKTHKKENIKKVDKQNEDTKTADHKGRIQSSLNLGVSDALK